MDDFDDFVTKFQNEQADKVSSMIVPEGSVKVAETKVPSATDTCALGCTERKSPAQNGDCIQEPDKFCEKSPKASNATWPILLAGGLMLGGLFLYNRLSNTRNNGKNRR